jgi:hypothetical protein
MSRPNIGIHIVACISDTGRVKLEISAKEDLMLRQQLRNVMQVIQHPAGAVNGKPQIEHLFRMSLFFELPQT